MSIFRTFRRKSGPPNSPTRTPKRGRSSENLGSSVISLDFREVLCADDCCDDNANNNNAQKDEETSNTEELFEDIDVMDTNQNINSYRSTNNIYVDIEEMSPYVGKCLDESLKTVETEVDYEDDYNRNLETKTPDNDSKNNFLLGNENTEDFKEEEETKSKEEILVKGFEKLSFTEKIKNKIRKSASTDAALSTAASGQDTKDNLKDRFSRFKTTNYRSLSETESEASRTSFKRLKPKRKRLFRQLTEEKNLMTNDEKPSTDPPDVIPTTTKKKSKSISSTILTHFREIKNGSNKVREIDPKDREKTKAMTNEMSNRLSEIKFLFETEAKDIEFEEIIESEASSLIMRDDPMYVYGDTKDEFSSMPPNIQITDLDEDEIPEQNLAGEAKPKFKFAQSIKSRLKLRLRRHKKLSETSLGSLQSPCAVCTKPMKMHASPTVADFEKEFHTSEIFAKDFCTCAREESCCSESSGGCEIKRHIDRSTNSSNSNCSVSIFWDIEEIIHHHTCC